MSEGEGSGCCQPRPQFRHQLTILLPGIRRVGHLSAIFAERQDGHEVNAIPEFSEDFLCIFLMMKEIIDDTYTLLLTFSEYIEQMTHGQLENSFSKGHIPPA